MSDGGNFIDYVKIYVRSGRGGAGSAHLKREKYRPKAGPDGGDGGHGGSVIVRGNKQFWTLLHLKYQKHIFAEDGVSGMRDTWHGKDGKDVIIEVPLGTVARDAETEEFLFEITEDGEQQVLAKGGRGGLGNVHFKSSTNQTPRYAQPGEDCEEGWKILELKVLADIGLVGFPNAGKSTLLSSISAARPKIADYPFTTLVPHLGIVDVDGKHSFVMADIPGIIEGASEGKGLGLRFLRHIERNPLLLFMIPADSNDAANDYDVLLNELGKYNPELLDKKRIIAITKCDLADSEIIDDIKAKLPADVPCYPISSYTKDGVKQLVYGIWDVLEKEQEEEPVKTETQNFFAEEIPDTPQEDEDELSRNSVKSDDLLDF
ncbi:MAG: GTPase ObgE [Bacteroidales bacterium]|nr:GTPase ObgE [Bacteroidales bacterium]MBR2105135.1 GTPase ObgE [Bacteroidales bacterium]MBR3713670.1 GTPase ObgE [Bacteroidales bacterium]MBR4273582.1 GTPase ObgE [Bacteroidales bacterium]